MRAGGGPQGDMSVDCYLLRHSSLTHLASVRALAVRPVMAEAVRRSLRLLFGFTLAKRIDPQVLRNNILTLKVLRINILILKILRINED